MPTIRDMSVLALSECRAQIVEHGAEVRARRERLLELPDEAPPLLGHRPVPGLAEPPREVRLDPEHARGQPVPLRRQGPAPRGVEAAGLRLLQRFLDLEHLREQLRRRLGLLGGARLGVTTLLEAHEVLDARDRVAQRAVRRVEPRGGLEHARLRLRGLRLVEVRVRASRQLVELPLQLGRVQTEPPGEPEDLEVIHAPYRLLKMRTGPPPGPFALVRRTRLCRERRPASTARLRLGVDECEAARQPLLDVVVRALLAVELERVRESGAPAALHAHAKEDGVG